MNVHIYHSCNCPGSSIISNSAVSPTSERLVENFFFLLVIGLDYRFKQLYVQRTAQAANYVCSEYWYDELL